MSFFKEMLIGATENEPNKTDQAPETEKRPLDTIGLSFYCITRAKDAHYLKGMLDSLPTGCECVIINTIHDASKAGETQLDRDEVINGIRYRMGTYFHGSWDFSKARNVALSYCTEPWCFWMDTDDRLIPWQHQDIKDIATLPAGIGGVYAGCFGFQPPYEDGKRGAYYAIPQLRAHRNIAGLQWKGVVHEQIDAQIKDLGYSTVEADLGVYHVGYVVDKEAMTAKMGRNVLLLCQQLATDQSYLTDYYTKALQNNINSYLEMKGQ